MAPIAAQSMRNTRTIGNVSPRDIRQSSSVPMNLETTYSDDSSVFSGLQDILSPTNEANHGQGSGNVNFGEQYLRDSNGPIGVSVSMSSLSGSGTERSMLRNMRSVADMDSAFGTETSASPSILSVKRDHNNNPTFYKNMHHEIDYISDHDESTMSFGTVYDQRRPKARTKLVAEVNLFDQTNKPPGQENQPLDRENRENQEPEEQEERIAIMLEEFEKQMEANLESIKEDEVFLPEMQEMQDQVPRRVKSEDEKQILTQHQAKKMQRILHQARKEVEVLRDNNEQFMAEIEQTEEEHSSEMKLLEEKTKQRIADMKVMYQEEIDALVKEKDAAIVEAGRQAERYAESGRKQISSLKRQIEKLKAQANGAVKKTVEDAITSVRKRKDEEMASRLGALRKSYENQLEKMRVERGNEVKAAVNEAVSALTQRMVVDRDRDINETILNLRSHLDNEKSEVVQSLRKSLDESTHKLEESRHEINELRQEREATIKALESVKENIYNHYPGQMEQMRKKTKNESGPMALIREGNQSKSPVERLFKEVIEAFAFLLDTSETKVASAKYLSEIEELKQERKEVYIKARKELIVRHRAEMDQTKKDQEDLKDKVHRLEESLKNLRREKRIVDDKFRRATQNHRTEITKLQEEKNAVLEMEKGRKELAVAMATGQLELAHSMASGRNHFLKATIPKNNIEKPGEYQQYPPEETPKQAMNDDSRDEIEASRSRENDDGERNIGKSSMSSDESINPLRHSKMSLPTPPPLPTHDTSVPQSTPALPLAAPDAPTNDIVSTDPSAIKASLSEASDLTRTSRSRRTVLGMVRDQSKGENEKKHAEDEDEMLKREPSGLKETQKPSESLKKKSFAILRSFKSSKGNTSPKVNIHKHTLEKPRDPVTSTQGKEPEGKSESTTHVRMTLPRRARKIKHFLDHLKTDECTRTRASLDGSLSSLNTNTGTGSSDVCSKSERLSPRIQLPNSKNKSERGYGRLGDELAKFDVIGPDRGNEKNKDDQGEKYSPSIRKKARKKRDGMKRSPLHMFANIRKDKERNQSAVETNEEQQHVENVTTSKPDAAEKIEDNNRSPPAAQPGTLNLKKGLPKESQQQIESTGVGLFGSELPKDASGPNPLQNLKPPLPGFHGKDGEMSPPPGHIISAKKPQCLEWTDTANDCVTNPELIGEVHVPGTISLRPSGKTQHVTPAASGHTMCLRPLSIMNNKGPNYDSVFGMSSDTNSFPVTMSGPSDTGTLTDDDSPCPAYDSQQQMRNFPALAGDDDSDDSGDDSADKYESVEPPAQFARNYSSPKHEGTRVPIVISRSIEEQSPVIFMDSSSSSDTRPIVVQGQPIYREPELSAFAPSPKRGISHTGSPAASSEATTAVTTHTFRSSLQMEPKTPLPKSPRDMQRPGSSGSSRHRRASSFASLRSRRNFKRSAEI